MATIPLNFAKVGSGGGSSAITVIDTLDENGGTIREIIAVDISKDTVSAGTLLQGYTAHDRHGNAITGTYADGSTPSLQQKTATPASSSQTITPDTGYDGLSSVTVEAIPSTYVIPTGTKSITANGVQSVSGYANVDVDVEPALQSKSTTPTTSSQTITPDANYDGLSSVTVNPIPSSYIVPSGTKTITTNGTHDVSSYASATVNVPTGGDAPELQSKEVSFTPSETAQSQTVSPDSGYDGLSEVSVSVGAISSTYVGSGISRRSSTNLTVDGATVTAPAGYYSAEASKTVASGTAGTPSATKGTVSNHSISVTPSVTNTTGYITGGTKTGTAVTVSASELVSGNRSISSNGTNIDVTNYKTVSVSVPTGGADPVLQSKTATPTESEQTITPDSGYDALSSVTVEAIDSGYVGSDVTRRSSTDLTVSGATVTSPAGYYAEAASKSVASGSASTPATSITANPSISVNATTGVITATASASKSVTPSVTVGYVSSGTAGTVTVSGSNTSQLTVQAAKTVIPTEEAQTAVAAGRYTTGAVNVAAIPSDYVGSEIATRSSEDLTASGATVTVPAGYYASQSSKSVASGSATTPATTITANPTISVSSSGLITATTSTSQNVTPTVSAGYVSSGTAGKITVSGSNTEQLTTKGATTYNVSSTNQTIASGTYLTGAQTIRAVTYSGLSAENIASGVTVTIGDSADADRIASVTGTLSFVTYYTGSSTPSSSTGSNGDIYLKTS